MGVSIRRVGELSIGYLVNWLIVHAFDYVLYPFVIWKLGLAWGFVVMALLSFVVCVLTLWFYDWSGRDWLGIEAVKQLRDYGGSARWRRWLSWAMRRGDLAACVLLSIKFDPFITTAYMRHGAFNGMSRRDWRNFLVSWFLGNAYWAFVCFGGIQAAQWVWRHWRG